MTDASKHIIEKFHIEFKISSEQNGKQIERQSIELLQQKLLPEIEKIFNRFGGKQDIRLDNLSIELDVKDPIRFEEEFVSQFVKQLSQKLEKAQKQISDLAEKEDSLFEYFLENGHFPWWAQQNSVIELEKKMLEKKKLKFPISTILKDDPVRLKRLVLQFSDIFLQTIAGQHADYKLFMKHFLRDLQRILSKYYIPAEVRNHLWISFFEALFFKNGKKEQVKIHVFNSAISHFSKQKITHKNRVISAKHLAEKILKELKISDKGFLMKLRHSVEGIKFKDKKAVPKTKLEIDFIEKKKHKPEQLFDQKEHQKVWYIDNAGLVLLHPFFVLFFEGIGLTNKNVFKDLHSKNQAALLLQYLATGNTQSFENELVLNKILCDIPLLTPLQKDLILDDKTKTEAAQLLNAVIKHWSALKNTSADGLRNTFLQREGKLTKNEDGSWKLFIQHSTFDILISKLPWSISFIKLPWMKNMLQVEWA